MSSPAITLIAGGVGGAKAAEGLAYSDYREGLKIIGNIGDDQRFHGLWVSPDIDTLTYTLADAIDREQGWGLKGDSNRVLSQLQQLGCDTWMHLGDLDFATHIYRSVQRQAGVRASDIARAVARGYGVDIPILLPTDDKVPTQLDTELGWLDFQNYFVAERCIPKIKQVCYHNAHLAKPTPEALEAIANAEIIVIAPSNPLLSIGAILAIPGIRSALENCTAPVLAISPLIGGQAVKGPAAKMMQEMDLRADSLGIAQYYEGLIDLLIIDEQDQHLKPAIEKLGTAVICTPTLMTERPSRVEVMSHIVERACDAFKLTYKNNRACA